VKKLNIGYGTDYKDGFINIDGSDVLTKVDKVIDIGRESLLEHFSPGEIDFILANDIVEHHFHWEAVRLLKDFYDLLAPGGTAEIRVPNANYIIKYWRIPIDRKITLLFGGQDIPQGNAAMDESRKKYPQFFCHKYGWTMHSMQTELNRIGFSTVICKKAGTNFVAYAIK